MSSARNRPVADPAPSESAVCEYAVPLTQNEIDRRIGDLASSLARDAEHPAAPDADRPRWIRPADLVERLAPYLTQN